MLIKAVLVELKRVTAFGPYRGRGTTKSGKAAWAFLFSLLLDGQDFYVILHLDHPAVTNASHYILFSEKLGTYFLHDDVTCIK